MLPVIADNFGRIHDTSIARMKILFPGVKMGEIYANFVYNSAIHIQRCKDNTFDRFIERDEILIEKQAVSVEITPISKDRIKKSKKRYPGTQKKTAGPQQSKK